MNQSAASIHIPTDPNSNSKSHADSLNKKIMIIGSTCVDIIINIDHLPKTEENIHPSSQSLALGGCAYNVASMVKQFGVPVTLISPVGTGFYGEFVAKELEKNGFPVAVHVPGQENGCCYCLVEAGGERTFMSYHGAEYTFRKEWMTPFDKYSYDMVYVCGLEIEEPTGLDLIESLESHPERELFYAPGPRGIRIGKEKMERIYALHPILHINELESKELSGCTSAEDAAEKLCFLTGNTVIVTLGENGTYCRERSGIAYTVPGIPTAVVDTIGAGDSHIGAVMASLSLGNSLRKSIHIANTAASAVVGVKGASLTEKEFREMSRCWGQKVF